MRARYLVRKIETCAACDGQGIVVNADWQRINEENYAWMEAHTGGIFTDEACADWQNRIKATWPYSDPPLEEEPCCECEGDGEIEIWIPLVQALQESGVFAEIETQSRRALAHQAEIEDEIKAATQQRQSGPTTW